VADLGKIRIMKETHESQVFDFSALPPEILREVIDFAEYLIQKKASEALPYRFQKSDLEHARRQLDRINERFQNPSHTNSDKLPWAGGLSEFKNEFTSLELQKKAKDWW
jgi:hypothetical protein